jgi:hypothetical protein
MEPILRLGDICWAKVKGFSWWPGVVADISEKDRTDGKTRMEYIINFIGNNSHAVVSGSKVQKFTTAGNDVPFNPQNKRLMSALQLAKKISKGEITYEHQKKTSRQKKPKFSDDNSSSSDDCTEQAKKKKETPKPSAVKSTSKAKEKEKEKDEKQKKQAIARTHTTTPKPVVFPPAVVKHTEIEKPSKVNGHTQSQQKIVRPPSPPPPIETKEQAKSGEPINNQVYDLSWLKQLMDYDKKSVTRPKPSVSKDTSSNSINASASGSKATKLTNTDSNGKNSAKKAKIENQAVQLDTTIFDDDLEWELEFDHKHSRVGKKKMLVISKELDMIIESVLEKVDTQDIIEDKDLSALDQILVKLKSSIEQINIKAIAETELLKKLNYLKSLLEATHSAKGTTIQMTFNKIDRIIEKCTTEITNQLLDYDDIKLEYKEKLKAKEKTKGIVPTGIREKSVREVKEAIIKKNLMNHSLAEPFARNYEEKIFLASKTKNEYDEKFASIVRAIQEKTSVNDIGELDKLFDINT